MTNLFQHPEWITAQSTGAPVGWAFTFINQERADSPIPGESMPLPNQSLPFHQPRISTAGGQVAVALESNPVWAGVAQLFTAQVGATYKLSVKILADLSHNGAPAGQDSSEFRFVAGGVGMSDWLSPIVGSINPYTMTFAAKQTNLNIGFEFRTRFGLSHIRWVLNEPVLELVSAAPSTGSGTDPNGTGTGDATNPPAPDKYAMLEKRLIALASVASLLDGDIEQLQNAIQNAQIELARVKAGG